VLVVDVVVAVVDVVVLEVVVVTAFEDVAAVLPATFDTEHSQVPVIA